MIGLSFSETLPVTKRATAAGTNVSDRSSAAVSASTTVNAIGWNIFPSTPDRAKMGTYTSVMMITPKIDGLITSTVASSANANRSSLVRSRPAWCCASEKRRRQFSTIMTAPSTIRPKSSAPRLIRLPETRLATMPVMVINIASGITIAVMIAARMLPSSRNKTTTTSRAPSTRLVSTVLIVRSTSSVLS